MSANRVTQLGYLGLDVADVSEWEGFATQILGLEACAGDAEDRLRLRLDANHHRLTLRTDQRDDIGTIGWEAPSERELEVIAERLQELGFSVEQCSDDEARDRHVMGLVTTCDPNGITTEIFHGPLVLADQPFRSQRAIAGFVAGRLGLGHIALNVDDLDACLCFYREGLGLLTSDYIELDLGEAGTATGAFLHCGPRHHSVAVVEIDATKRLHHLMLELVDLDDVGRTYDLCREQEVPISLTFGRHTNDRMLSFYLRTPSGFQVEYGHGGRLIDDDDWQVQLHHAASIWGHQPTGG